MPAMIIIKPFGTARKLNENFNLIYTAMQNQGLFQMISQGVPLMYYTQSSITTHQIKSILNMLKQIPKVNQVIDNVQYCTHFTKQKV